jgi:hypothetical protein
LCEDPRAGLACGAHSPPFGNNSGAVVKRY